MREIGIHGDKVSCDEQAVEDFKFKFEKFLQKEKISYKHESGLFWKCLPTQTLAFKSEQHVPGHKGSKKCLTIMT